MNNNSSRNINSNTWQNNLKSCACFDLYLEHRPSHHVFTGFFFLATLNKHGLNYFCSNHSFQVQSSLILKHFEGYHGLWSLSVQGEFLAVLSSTSATQLNHPGWLANFYLCWLANFYFYKYTVTDNSKSKILSLFQ